MLTDTHRRVQMLLKGRLNNTQIADLTNCSRATVRTWRERLKDCDLAPNAISELSETELRRLVAPGVFSRKQDLAEPDFDKIRFEVDERSVRLKTLYIDYRQGVPDGFRAMSRTTFYRTVAQMADKKDVTLSFDYEPGEMIQADFVGRKKLKQPLLLDEGGSERDYEVFCAASAKSRKIFVCALESQATVPVLGVMVRMLEYFGGVPVLVTIDNFKAAVAVPRRGAEEATITSEFAAFADYYGFSFIATRVRKPRDKGIVENAVGIVQDDVLAPLRNRRFFSLAEMNAALSDRVTQLNERPMRGHGDASRNDLFSRSDFSGYQPLPSRGYEVGRYILKLRAGRDYHVEVEGSRYSVPWHFAGELLNVKITPTSVHLIHEGRTVATHPRHDQAAGPITTPTHMPAAHAAGALTRLAGMKRYVAEIGPNAEALIDAHFRANKKPALTATAAINLRALAERYPAERVENACELAISIKKANVRKVEAILVAGLDADETEAVINTRPVAQRNIRGAGYFAELINSAREG
ncbi:IS21 family transposase [Rhodobacter xanthinilyticus]|nr:IS21 family transposase [Rhodobacter xanthinilyticus]